MLLKCHTQYASKFGKLSSGHRSEKGQFSFQSLRKAMPKNDQTRKDRGTRDQMVNICWIMEKTREFQKNINFCFIDYPKAFDCVDHNKLWKILKNMGIPDHLTCLLRNLYAGQEATVRIGHGTTDWF